jgi:hypothetical protein
MVSPQRAIFAARLAPFKQTGFKTRSSNSNNARQRPSAVRTPARLRGELAVGPSPQAF